MSDISTLVVNDGQATPVSHTFTPVNVGAALVEWHDKSADSVLGRPSVTLGDRKPTAQNGNRKVTLRIKVPVLETVSPAATGYTPGPTLAYTLSANMDIILPSRASQAEIDDLYAYMKNVLSLATMDAVVTADDFPY